MERCDRATDCGLAPANSANPGPATSPQAPLIGSESPPDAPTLAKEWWRSWTLTPSGSPSIKRSSARSQAASDDTTTAPAYSPTRVAALTSTRKLG